MAIYTREAACYCHAIKTKGSMLYVFFSIATFENGLGRYRANNESFYCLWWKEGRLFKIFVNFCL